MNEKFQEIKTRVIENKFSREDALELVAMVEELEIELDDYAEYLLDEVDFQNEEDIQ